MEKLVKSHLDFMQVKESAVDLAKSMENEDGAAGAVKAFHKHLPSKKHEDEPEPLPEHSRVFSIRQCFSCS